MVSPRKYRIGDKSKRTMRNSREEIVCNLIGAHGSYGGSTVMGRVAARSFCNVAEIIARKRFRSRRDRRWIPLRSELISAGMRSPHLATPLPPWTLDFHHEWLLGGMQLSALPSRCAFQHAARIRGKIPATSGQYCAHSSRLACRKMRLWTSRALYSFRELPNVNSNHASRYPVISIIKVYGWFYYVETSGETCFCWNEISFTGTQFSAAVFDCEIIIKARWV